MDSERPGMHDVREVRVVVGLATFRRPRELARALPPILDQVATLRGPEARLVVVDNDPDGSAQDLVTGRGHPLLQYVHEPVPGIAAARNRAMAAAGSADAIVFIDDDEVPMAGWLQALVDAWLEWRCAGVAGPVTYEFEGPADEWVRAAAIFEGKVRRTGSVTPGASTANLLLDLEALRRNALAFDHEFGISGGSDTMLTHTLRMKGLQIRWCQEAAVTEFVASERSTHEYVSKRNIRTANTWSRVTMRLTEDGPERWRKRAELTARGGYRLMRGVGLRGAALIRRDVRLDARGAYDWGSGLGVLMGAYGKVRSEYERPIG